jgi:hypothetical protein
MPQIANIIAREKWGIIRLNHAYQEASTNAGLQKAQCSIRFPSHGNFEEATLNT